ncbi:MAG: C40 family peptidase [Flavobacteriaceae bacterium]|nr:C40 family peptidase [Bacteroidia bacterium]NNK87642.1 C40 family peptidase [Flavobacteriaceae bacterium]
MNRIIGLLTVLMLFLTGCKSSKNTIVTTNKHKSHRTENHTANTVVRHALNFEGVRYKYGGTTKRGMDCSGLIYVSFKEASVELPRISRDMARRGIQINRSEVQAGDLLFFRTNKRRKNINHVGLVTNTRGTITFIHSTTTRGVITSSLNEDYWKKAFVEARRVL